MIGIDNAAAHLGGGPNYLKREILFFDRIVLLSASAAILEWREGRYNYKFKYRDWADELEYLLDTGLFEDKPTYSPFLPESVGTPEAREGYRVAVKEMQGVWEKIRNLDSDPEYNAMSVEGRGNAFLYLTRLLSSLHMRVEALARQAAGQRAVALNAVPMLASNAAAAVTSGDLLEIVIERVPMPDELTPWKDILDLKNEEEFNSRLRKLRQWCTEMAKSGATRDEADEAVSELIFEYETYMKATRLKIRSGLLKTAVVGSAELLENLVKFRWGKMAKGLFSATEARADLLLAEQQAPGRAISIVPMLHDRLTPKVTSDPR